MRSYETPGSRTAFGIAALAMTAATIGLLVIAPARFDTQAAAVLTASAQDARAGHAYSLAWPANEAE
jgi:hypothetical protein